MKLLKPSVVLRLFLLSACLCFSWLWAERLAQSLRQPYAKDFRSGYLLAQALRHGVNPYLPLPELGRLWLPENPQLETDFPHPTPHPFAVGWLCLPLTALTYPQAATVWLLFEVACLLASVILWLRLVGWPVRWWPVRWWSVGALLVVLTSWIHLMTDLFLGQLTLCLLLLFLLAWTALRAGRDGWGGVWLAGLLVLKLMGWPIVLWLAWQRRWRAVLVTGLVWLGVHGLAMALHGWRLVADYYLKAGPAVAAFYRARDNNFSLFSLGQRFFAPSGHYLSIVPWWNAPHLAKLLTVLVPGVFLLSLWWAVRQVRCFDTAFAFLMAAGFWLSPVVWSHYFLLAWPALGLLLKRLAARGWPGYETSAVGGLLLLLWLPLGVYFAGAAAFAHGTTASGLPIVSATAATLTLLPAVALGLLLWRLLHSAPVAVETKHRVPLWSAPGFLAAAKPALRKQSQRLVLR